MAVVAALLSSLCYAFGSVAQHRSAAGSPSGRTWRLLLRLVGRPMWVLGFAAGGAGLALHAYALAHGSLVVVQPLLVSGLVFALPASLLLDRRTPTMREWKYACAVVCGLAVFLIAAHPSAGKPDADPAQLLAATAVAVALVSAIFVLSAASGQRHRAALLGIAAGICFGTTGALLKQLVGQLSKGPTALLTTWPPYAFLAIGSAGIVLAQKGFQAGPLASSLPALTIVDPVVSIAIGSAVFGEALATGVAALSGQVAGLMLTAWAARRLALIADTAERSAPCGSNRSPDGHWWQRLGRTRRRTNAQRPGTRVLIVSASVGGGHDGAAAELARRLASVGIETCVVDFLDMLPLGSGRLLRSTYRAQLRFAPKTYGTLYRASETAPGAWRAAELLCTLLTRRRLVRRIEAVAPHLIVSVYPLSSLALGRMRAKEWLDIPVVTYLTDFSVHPFWVHPAIDLHLTTNVASRHEAIDHGAGHTTIVGPLVRPMFDNSHDRLQARERLGISAERPVGVLVVAGSWGVGSVEGTVKAIAAAGPYHPVCVCGRNDHLRQELERLGVGSILGWVERMDEVMAGCDVVVENAGGLTCMEALTAGLPVVTYAPIPGHGERNAQMMAAAGLVRYARDESELSNALLLAATTRLIENAHGARARTSSTHRATLDAADQVRTLADRNPSRHPIVKAPRALRRTGRASAILAATYLTATSAFGVASARGLGVNRTGTDRQRPTIIGVRLNTQQLNSDPVARALSAGGITAVVDDGAACSSGGTVKAYGLTLASSGDGRDHRFAWRQAEADVSSASHDIVECTGKHPRWFVALREVNAFDWMVERDTPLDGILAPHVIGPGASLGALAPHRLYVIDATSLSPSEAQAIIENLATARSAKLVTLLR